jgi:hypothetical protein
MIRGVLMLMIREVGQQIVRVVFVCWQMAQRVVRCGNRLSSGYGRAEHELRCQSQQGKDPV